MKFSRKSGTRGALGESPAWSIIGHEALCGFATPLFYGLTL